MSKCTKKIVKIVLYIIVYIFLLLNFTKIYVHAAETNTSYILLYDKLYGYGEQSSEVLQLYIDLKSNDQAVKLLQVDDFNEDEIKEDDKIVVIYASFDSKEKYNNTLDYLNSLGLKKYDERRIYLDQTTGYKGLFIGIDEVYPFSDLNKLMDISEGFNDSGIEFICTIMPVYENYELEAYDKFIEVLKYVHKKGGQIFIHYPVINEEVTYDTDPKAGLEKAIEEYRKRGLEIRGITLPQDNLFMNLKAIKDLDVQFLLITDPKTKVDANLDLFQVSEEINKYTLIKGVDINSFNIFSYKNTNYSNPELVYLRVADDVKKLKELLEYLRSEKIQVKDFKVGEYENMLKHTNPTKINEDNNKTELDKFREEELKKIKGENLDKNKQGVQGYDLSKIVNIAIKIAVIIILILIVQVTIARRYDNEKFFKK